MENEIINKTYLSHRGYGLLKSQFNYRELNKIKDELTVSPKTMNSFVNANPVRYNIYTESSKKLYIPKYYGLQNFGIPDKNKLLDGIDIDLKFNGELRENQVKPVERFLEAAKDPFKMGGLKEPIECERTVTFELPGCQLPCIGRIDFEDANNFI